MKLRIVFVLFVIIFITTSFVEAYQLKSFTVEKDNPLKKMGSSEAKIQHCGYKDESGKVVIKPEYKTCSAFKNGVVTVEIHGYHYSATDRETYSLFCLNATGAVVNNGACQGYSGLPEQGEDLMQRMFIPIQ